jgi:hypothetical protein
MAKLRKGTQLYIGPNIATKMTLATNDDLFHLEIQTKNAHSPEHLSKKGNWYPATPALSALKYKYWRSGKKYFDELDAKINIFAIWN